MVAAALAPDPETLGGRLLGMANRSSERLEELVEGVLRLAGHQAPQLTAVDLDAVVTEVLEGMAETWPPPVRASSSTRSGPSSATPRSAEARASPSSAPHPPGGWGSGREG